MKSFLMVCGSPACCRRLPHYSYPSPASCPCAAVEHKIETLVAAPAAVEEALASLIVDNQDRYHALQYRALVTYVKRIYHPFLMCEPQVRLCVCG